MMSIWHILIALCALLIFEEHRTIRQQKKPDRDSYGKLLDAFSKREEASSCVMLNIKIICVSLPGAFWSFQTEKKGHLYCLPI